MKNLNDILESQEFNDLFNIEQEVAELEKDGWTLQEVMDFAQSMVK
jgi:hypothetical protein